MYNTKNENQTILLKNKTTVSTGENKKHPDLYFSF